MKKEHWDLLRNKTFYGFDFDGTMLRIGVMNMILHGIKQPNIVDRDSLSKRFDQTKQYDIVLANPPFAGSIDEGDINDNLRLDTTKTELLFIELFYNILKTGGKAAIIAPEGVLSTTTNAHKRLRKLLLEKCQLEGVITMPAGVFKPYSGVSTTILLFIKGGKTDNVWFYEMKSDGLTLDDKRKKIDGKGDIPDIISEYSKKRKSKNSFLVSVDEIRKNDFKLNPTIYKEQLRKKVKFTDPKSLLDNLLNMENEIESELKALKKTI